MVSAHVLHLCQAKETVTSAIEKHPAETPGDVFNQLYGHINNKEPCGNTVEHGSPLSPLASKQALRCGRWGSTKPSPLFLQAFAGSLSCLDVDPLLGIVSPPLMGSHGTVPLTIVAPLIDIARHCSNLIVRADREVFFITSMWQPSAAQKLIKNALIELSKRAGKRGQQVSVKVMFDKAALSNIFDPHRPVKPAEWTAQGIQLPSPEEIPHVELEVLSFHHLPLGTLHMKFCVVDREMAAVMSNNVEDNDNLEMMIQVEGPIVEGIYDTALIAWNKHIRVSSPASWSSDMVSSTSGQKSCDVEGSPEGTAEAPADQTSSELTEHTSDNPHYDDGLAGEVARIQFCYSPKAQETQLQATSRQLDATAKNPVGSTGPEIPDGQDMTPYVLTTTSHPVPMALVSRPAYGALDKSSLHVPQNGAWLSLIRNAQRSIFIQTPDLNAAPLLPAIAAALERGVEVTYYVCFGYNDAGEIIPGQGGSNEQAAQALMQLLPASGPERDRLHIYDYVAKDQDHPIHQSFKSRSCHIKLLIVDDTVAVQGSGNQDTQSWFHSQEINVMVDSPEICAKWRDAIERNQNTKMFGEVAKDGVWRDGEGNHGDGYMGDPGPVEGLLWGVGGMFKKIREAGGF